MKEKEDVLSLIKVLWHMAEERGYATTSAFLSEEERAKFLQSIKGERGASYFLLPENGERQLFVFYPSFMTLFYLGDSGKAEKIRREALSQRCSRCSDESGH